MFLCPSDPGEFYDRISFGRCTQVFERRRKFWRVFAELGGKKKGRRRLRRR